MDLMACLEVADLVCNRAVRRIDCQTRFGRNMDCMELTAAAP